MNTRRQFLQSTLATATVAAPSLLEAAQGQQAVVSSPRSPEVPAAPPTQSGGTGLQIRYSDCPVFAASGVAVETGILADELRRVGAYPAHFSTLRVGYLPHFNHKLDRFFRDGGAIPAIWAKADNSDTTLVGLTACHDGGQILVRSDSNIYRVAELKGRRIGLGRTPDTGWIDWSAAVAERGILLALALAGLKPSDVEIIDISFKSGLPAAPKPGAASTPPSVPDGGKKAPPEWTALKEGKVDAIFGWQGFPLTLERTGEFKVIEDLRNHPDWTLQVTNSPYAITVNTELARERPDVVVAYLRASIRSAHWIKAEREKAAAILTRLTHYTDVSDVLSIIDKTEFVPSLSPQNLAGIRIQKQFLFEHGYIKRDFDVGKWANPSFLAEALRATGPAA